MLPAFKLQLNNAILKRLAAVGKYDGEHPSLTCATNAGKIFFHSPHEKDKNNEVRFLNINRKISTLSSGPLISKSSRETLLVGAQTTLLAYDVLENRDLFFKDAPDGVNTVVVGVIGDLLEPLALVGGNCSIQGFDHEGNEAFWTVTGDNVSAMTFCDVDEDGQLELLVGSDDFEIRVFRNEEVISETTETDRPICLASLRRHTFGYGLANGTIGVYDKPAVRRWRVKSKYAVTAVHGFDLDGDGQPEIISGWDNGKFEVRSDRSGEVIFKETLGASVSAILTSDYRCDGHTEVMVCTADGEVRGYLPMGEEGESVSTAADGTVEEETLRELQQRKQELLFELKQFEDNMKKARSGERAAGLVAADTVIKARLQPSRQDACLYLTLSASNEASIRAAAVFAERVFEGESFVVHQRDSSTELRLPLRPVKDVQADLNIKTLVGGRNAETCHVFEMVHRLPKFGMYMPVESRAAKAAVAGVSFQVKERSKRVKTWLADTFYLGSSDGLASVGSASNHGLKEDDLEQGFVSLRDGQPLWIRMTSEVGCTVQIHTEDMELAGEVLQDLCSSLGITELESVAEFPLEMEKFREVLLKVDEYNAARLRLTAEMADSSNQAKTLVIKAEDARLLGDMKSMRAAYGQLYSLNAELIGEYNKRANNHEHLLAALKDVNHMIQKAARLRVGSAKTRVVTACRGAIKANNIHLLFKIIKTGQPTTH
uniref:Bardet-Biedl syndrome 2 protein homolog n=1 Tax=Coccolithus braarudii TaxID=221442 RepID=A0A7S0L2Q7_9EUKA|mmetsp:Transcript_14214/g.30862  ORF Transcript_14214/g.30862 Transcript_14214/m.30862 type:complete len:715 (+) Transcript_14214:22-2166(+)